MDDIQKSRVRLTHWIEHNEEHQKGYEEVERVLETQGATAAAARIRQGIALVEAANKEFHGALGLLPVPDSPECATPPEKGAGHTHHHHHSHEDSDEHGHEHPHTHHHDKDHHH
jgi:hypothetical protein